MAVLASPNVGVRGRTLLKNRSARLGGSHYCNCRTGCIARPLETGCTSLVTRRGPFAHFDSAAANNESRSSGRVYIARPPSGVRGHSSWGRSQYNSTPLPSGSRK